jgi:hypothetical protein
VRPGQSYHYAADTPQEAGELMLECLRRLDSEGNRALLEVPAELTAELSTEVDRLRADNRRLRRRLARVRQEQQHRSAGLTGRVRRLFEG